jgi:hypothetical protein
MSLLAEPPPLPISQSGYAAEQWGAILVVVGLAGVLAGVRRWHSLHNPTYRELKERSQRPPPGTDAAHWKTALDRYRRTHGTAVWMGSDGRVSTSKTIATLWTALLAYMLIVMGLVAAFSTSPSPGDVLNALVSPTSNLYLVLLGGPFAAAVLAKVIVSNGVASGRVQKTYAAATTPNDVTGNDRGNTDLVDSQYTLFNLIAVVIVLVAFVRKPGFGAPPIPDFLAVLTGASAATYVANKAAVTNAPVINRVLPQVVRIGQVAAAYGENLYSPTTTASTVVSVGGFAAEPVAGRELPSEIWFTVPTPTGGTYPADLVEVVIKTVAGATAVLPGAIRIVPDAITITGVKAQITPAGTELVVSGSGFFNAASVASDGRARQGAAWPMVQLTPVANGDARTIPWPGQAAAEGMDTELTVPVPGDTPPGNYRLTISRDGLSSSSIDQAPVVQLTAAAQPAAPVVPHVSVPIGGPGADRPAGLAAGDAAGGVAGGVEAPPAGDGTGAVEPPPAGDEATGVEPTPAGDEATGVEPAPLDEGTGDLLPGTEPPPPAGGSGRGEPLP